MEYIIFNQSSNRHIFIGAQALSSYVIAGLSFEVSLSELRITLAIQQEPRHFLLPRSHE
jgi:hypothetical protein